MPFSSVSPKRCSSFSKRLLDECAFGHQFRIRLTHDLDQRRHHGVEERLFLAEHPTVTQSAADDPAQHVAAAFVGRQHAVDDQETARADMIGDHAQRLVFQIAGIGQARRFGDQALEQVDLVIRMHVLQHRGEALQAHAGVDARRRQRRQRAVGGAVELHEDEIPDLDVAVAVLVRRAGRAAGDVGAVVDRKFPCTGRRDRCRPSARNCPTRTARPCCRRCARCARPARRRPCSRCRRLRHRCGRP